jgi:hypothetical protein
LGQSRSIEDITPTFGTTIFITEILKIPGHVTIYNILHFYSHPQTDRNAHPRSFHDLLVYLFGDNSMIPSLKTFKSPKSPQLLGRKPLNILEPSPHR